MKRAIVILVVVVGALAAWVFWRSPQGAVRDAEELIGGIRTLLPQTGTASVSAWSATTVGSYYSPLTPQEELLANAKDSKGVADLMISFLTAASTVKLKAGDESAVDLFLLIPRYRVVFRDGHVIATQWDVRKARIKFLTQQIIETWKTAFSRLNESDFGEAATVLLVIDAPSLFPSTGYDTARSSLLLARVNGLSKEQVERLSEPLGIFRAWAALLIAQNDSFFDGTALNGAHFAEGMTALKLAMPKKAVPPT